MMPKTALWMVTFTLLTLGLGGRSTLAATFADLLQEADHAYQQRDYAKAADLYTKMLSDPGLDRQLVGSIKSKRAICQINLEGKAPVTPPPTTAPASQPTTQPGDARERHVHAKPLPGEIRTLDIKELGNFDYDPLKGGGIPNDVKQLSGLRVRLIGFMVPLNQTDQITEFALVPSLTSCCYGAPPQAQHTIMVTCPAKSAATYSADLVVVQGEIGRAHV